MPSLNLWSSHCPLKTFKVLRFLPVLPNMLKKGWKKFTLSFSVSIHFCGTLSVALTICSFFCTWQNEKTHFVGCRKKVPSKKVNVRELSKAEELLKESFSLPVLACFRPDNRYRDLPSIPIDNNVFILSKDRTLAIGKKKKQRSFTSVSEKLGECWVTFSLSELKGFSEESSFTYRLGVPLPRLL